MAKGSHIGFGDYPRVCHGCGERVFVSKRTGPAIWFQGNTMTWHFACHPLIRNEESEAA